MKKENPFGCENCGDEPRTRIDEIMTVFIIFVGIVLVILCYFVMVSNIIESRNDKIVKQQSIKHKNDCQLYFARNSGGQFNDKVVTYSESVFLDNQCSFSVCNKNVDYSKAQYIWQEINIFNNNCGWIRFNLTN